MTALDRETQRALVAEASLAPSVHNVQPARWRFLGADTLVLFEDQTRRLQIGDPTGRDNGVSLGAAAEGMAIALSKRDLRLNDEGRRGLPDAIDRVVPVRCFAILPGATRDPLAAFVTARQSYRGKFTEPTSAAVDAARRLGAEDVAVVAHRADIDDIAGAFDTAGLRFFRDDAFRAELVSWMRLSRKHPCWSIDGLNAEAMAMSRIEAAGAGVALSRTVFHAIDKVGLAGTVTSDGPKVRSAAAILLIHRPANEDPFETGRAFYRLWLRVTEAGFAGAIMASLADDPATAQALRTRFAIPQTHRLTSAVRIGRAPPSAAYSRARIHTEALFV